MSEPLSTKNRDTSVPLIQAKHHARFRLVSAQPGQSDNGPTFKLRWDLIEPAPSNRFDANGQPIIIMPGTFPGIHLETIFCYSKSGGKQAPDHFVDKLCDRVDACLGTAKEDNVLNKPARPEIFAPGASLGPQGEYTVLQGQVSPEVIGAIMNKEIVAEMRITKDSRDGSDRQEFGKLYFPEDYKG